MNKFIRALLLVALLATAFPLAAPAAADGGSQYTVRSGDSLIRIARNNDVTLQALVDANKAAFPCLARPTPCPILTGQKLSLPAAKNIVTMAVEAGSFNTLVAAVQAAGLVEALQGPGPFTVLAPTDAAFAKLPKATLEALLANPDKLREVLLYHVIPAKARSTDVVKLTSLIM